MFDIGQQCCREAWEKLTAQNSECISRSGEVAIPRNQEQSPSNRSLSPTDCIDKLGSRTPLLRQRPKSSRKQRESLQQECEGSRDRERKPWEMVCTSSHGLLK